MLLRPTYFFLINWVVCLAIDFMIGSWLPIFYTIYNDTYIYVFLCIFAMIIGGVFGKIVVSASLVDKIRKIFHVPINTLGSGTFWATILFFIFIVTGIERTFMVGSSWFTPVGIDAYRQLVTEDGENRLFPFLSVFNFFIFLAGAFLVHYRNSLSIGIKIILFIEIILFFYIGSARSLIFFVLLIAIFALVLTIGFRLWMVLVPFILAALFLIFGAIAGKDDPFGLVIYYLSPIHAFSELFSGAQVLGENYDLLSFRFLHSLLKYLGLISTQVTMLPYIETPLITIVYSFFYVYWLDFGWFSLIFWFLFGICSDFIYRWYLKSKNFTSLSVLSLLLASITLSVFYDYFTSSAFVYISGLILFFFFPDYRPLNSGKFDSHGFSDRVNACTQNRNFY